MDIVYVYPLLSTYLNNFKTIKVDGQFIQVELRPKYLVVVSFTFLGDILQRKVKWLLESASAVSMRFMQL